MPPSVLNSFHVPLVDYSHEGLPGQFLIDIVENIIFLLIDEDPFLLWGDLFEEFDIPSAAVFVKRFSKTRTSQNGQ